jgi:hypothetical protein
MKKLATEILTLGTARGRVWFFGIASVIVFLVPYNWLNNLSIWQRIGWNSAPSIGLTRAYHLLIHGNPIAAWHRNPLIFLVIIVWFVIMVKDIQTLQIQRKNKHGSQKVTNHSTREYQGVIANE